MNKALHIVSANFLATLVLAAPVLAHPGHGFFGDGLAHYLASPGHAFPVIAAGVIAGLAMVASRRAWLVRSGGFVLSLSAVMLLAVLIRV